MKRIEWRVGRISEHVAAVLGCQVDVFFLSKKKSNAWYIYLHLVDFFLVNVRSKDHTLSVWVFTLIYIYIYLYRYIYIDT